MAEEDFARLLDSEFLDEGYLARTLGLSRAQREEFVVRYGRLAPAERPSLSPFFDPAWYRDANDDVSETGVDPLLHFVDVGVFELRAPHPLISLTRIYDDNRPLFYREGGCRSLNRVLGGNLSDPCDYFDVEFYLDRYEEARRYEGGALRHFIEIGPHKWLWPNPYFDPQWYSAQAPEIARNSVAALRHFMEIGDRRGRSPSIQFDPQGYLDAHPDVAAAETPPLLHFLRFGRHDGRPVQNGGLRIPVPQEPGDQPEPGLAADLAPAEGGLERYRRLRDRIAAERRRRLTAFAERDIRPIKIGNLGEALRLLAFPQPAAQPKLSILIPCHNAIAATAECLLSILASEPALTYEVVIGDDASSEPEYRELAAVPGLRCIRHPSNLHFLRNCNAIFPQLCGEYLLLLNNDAQVMPGAIDRLAAALDADPDLAAVGPQILFPNGRLQEAGCAVGRDGGSVMIGVFEDPQLAGYNYRRPVDYVSGAALMLRRAALEGDLFDERFAPAYCEDVDLCLTLRARGKKIEYLPHARVVHHLSLITAKQSHRWKQQRIARNQQKLIEKWGERLDEISSVRVIALYLPQYHPIAQNDLWWGAGFTDWTNVAAARPSYAGHLQPRLPADLGFYDPRSPEVLGKQAALAARYGVSGFCVYYYRLGGRRLLETPLETLLAHREIPFPFCICWANENWSRRWDGGDQELLAAQSYDPLELAAIAADIARYITDPRYITVNGKPIVLVYRPLLLPDPRGIAALFRQVAAAAGKALHLVYAESMETAGSRVAPADIGFDAAVEFPPHQIGVLAADPRRVVKPGWDGHRYDYEATVVAAVTGRRAGYPRYPAVFPGWDNTPRQPMFGTSFDHASPEAFQLYVEEKLAEARAFFTGEERLLFVNAWNEWAEGCYLEPDQRFGHRWLEALRNALAAD